MGIVLLGGDIARAVTPSGRCFRASINGFGGLVSYDAAPTA
jgi:hypothetical protein